MTDQQARFALSRVTDGVRLLDREGQTVWANPAGERCAALFAREAELSDALRRVAAGGAGERHEVTSDGRSYEVELSPTDGGVLAIARDVTERRHFEAQLRRDDNRFARLADAGIFGVVVSDHSGYLVEVNDAFVALIGYSRDELLSGAVHARQLTPPEWTPGDQAARAQVQSEGRARPWRKELLRKDGSRAPVMVGVVALDAGHYLTVVVEIAELRKGEELAAANRFLDSIIETMPAMVFVKDARDLRFVRFNRAGEELLGWNRNELIGKSDYDFFPKEEADFFVGKDREVLASGTELVIPEEPIQTKRGQRILHTKKIPIADEQGTPLYLLGISLDVTDVKRAEEQLRKAYRSLEELNARLEEQNRDLVRANRAKSEFLAMMSHELRTPLNSIIGFSEVLNDQKVGPLSDKQRKYLKNVEESGKHLLGLINDLLDLSKIDAGRLEVVVKPSALAVLAAEAIATLAPLADGKQLAVTLEAGELPPALADPTRYKQVLYNLLSNAIKFTPAGRSIVVRCTRRDDRIRTEVIDTGSGIAPDDLKRLFRHYTQLDTSVAAGGTGLGLALTKELADLMSGTLGVESELGRGSCFWIDLPVAGQPASQ